MVARAHLREHLARRRAFRHALRGEDVIQAPADVAGPHVAPGRPPGEEVVVRRIGRAAHIDEVLAEEPLEKVALLGALADDARLALARMHVALAACDVDVAAQDDGLALLVHRVRPLRERLHEVELGRIVLAAVRYVHRGEHRLPDLCRDDARFHVEGRVLECDLARQRFADVKGNPGVRAHAMPERMVVLEHALLGDLRRLGLELLQAHDVRPVALEPFAHLRGPGADAVDVPRRNLHGFGVRAPSPNFYEPLTTLSWLSTPFTPSILAASCAARRRWPSVATAPHRLTL